VKDVQKLKARIKIESGAKVPDIKYLIQFFEDRSDNFRRNWKANLSKSLFVNKTN